MHIWINETLTYQIFCFKVWKIIMLERQKTNKRITKQVMGRERPNNAKKENISNSCIENINN